MTKGRGYTDQGASGGIAGNTKKKGRAYTDRGVTERGEKGKAEAIVIEGEDRRHYRRWKQEERGAKGRGEERRGEGGRIKRTKVWEQNTNREWDMQDNQGI